MFSINSYISWFRKNISLRDVCIIMILIAAYFVTRIIYLDHFPIFGDEGIYIRWAKVAWHDASWRFISLTDGRQPLQTWGTIPFLKFFPDNALFAGRMYSVAAGFAGMSGLTALAWYLFNKKTAYIAATLYIVTPYFLFYDRMALADSSITAGVLWMLFLTFVLVRTIRLDVALLLGGVMGMTFLGKSSAKLYSGLFYLVGLWYFLDDPSASIKNRILNIITLASLRKNSSETIHKIINFSLLYAGACFIAFVIYNIQRLSPYFHFVSEKNKTFVLTFSELLHNPFQLLAHNLVTIPYYIGSELTIGIAVIAIAGLILLFKKNFKLALILALIWVLAYVGISAVAKVVFPRYLQALGALAILPASYFIASIKDRRLVIGVWVVVLASVGYFNYTLIFDQSKIPFPAIDRGQYIEGWPAGSGMKEIVEYVRQQSQGRDVIILAEGDFGVSGDVLSSLLKPGDKIDVKGYWPLELPQLQLNQKELETKRVFVVFAHRTDFPADWPITLVKKYTKPGNQSAFYLFELNKTPLK